MNAPIIDSTPEFVTHAYRRLRSSLDVVRRRLGRPLSATDKILLGHLDDPDNQELVPGQSYLALRPDRVALQDVTGQMALLQFAQAHRDSAAVPTTIHCDHLIVARDGAVQDLSTARARNREVYDFLRSAAAKYGLGFWGPGAGIIHQVVLENYAFPGGLMIGTDSHTPNAGGLGMLAAGVGGADAVDVMAGLPWEVLYPRRVGVRLTGRLRGWTAPKDVILWLLGRLTVRGGTNRIIEYFGPGAATISCTGKATITNMGAELGATCSVFPFDQHMATYLAATGRRELADLAAANADLLTADAEVEEHPEQHFDELVELDLDQLEPHLVGPHTPDLAHPLSRLSADVAAGGWPAAISATLLGSCTNSSYEDLARAADVARQAAAHGVSARVPLLVAPGSERVRATTQRDGQLAALADIGAVVLANACGPCIGQWDRGGAASGPNSIVTSFNRNFAGRNDANPDTAAFIASPELAVALALAGRLSFDPRTDELPDAQGRPWRLAPPGPAPEVPASGFAGAGDGFLPPPAQRADLSLVVDPKSDRLQVLTPFAPWDGRDFVAVPLLIKIRGKCTTDQISPAGPWLRFRGHLSHISDNMLLGAVNAFTGQRGTCLNQLTGERDVPVPKVARAYKDAGQRWVVVGDENYGEGSSREHAAMSPRYLGAAAIITRSFARIHESNLKKQGVLPLTFVDPADYDLVREDDHVSLVGLADLAPGREVTARLHHADGSVKTVRLQHSLNREQIAWFAAGSALNLIASQAG